MTVYQVFYLLGGVGLFLFGMSIMSTGLRNAAGDKLRDILENVTSNKVKAVLMGVLVTVLVQSSSATDMMVIGFVSSGLMSLTQAIGVIMGANIGTTITAQITAFNISAIAPIILFIGCVMNMFLKKDFYKHVGSVIMGFGMLFVGIAMIKEVIAPLAESEGFVNFLSALSNPFVAILFGVGFTALLQSSSSSTVIFQAFAVQGILEYHTAVYLIIGAAIGSVTPNILAGFTTNRNGKRTAILNLIFNLFRAVILTTLITIFPQILNLIQGISPNNVARQIANTHTIFAIVAVLIMLPFTKYIVAIANKVIPVLPEETRAAKEKQLVYMADDPTNMPEVSIRQAMMELGRLGGLARNNVELAMDAFVSRDPKEYAEVEETESIVDFLTNEISERLVNMRALQLSERDTFRVSKLTLVASNYERISDHAENIIEYAQKMDANNSELSEKAIEELKELGKATLASIDICTEIFVNEDFAKMPEADALEDKVDDLQELLIDNHVKRLMDNTCDPIGGVVFTDICTDLERCSDHAINIAIALRTDVPMN